jgi:hypothetical protein
MFPLSYQLRQTIAQTRDSVKVCPVIPHPLNKESRACMKNEFNGGSEDKMDIADTSEELLEMESTDSDSLYKSMLLSDSETPSSDTNTFFNSTP